MRMQAVKAEDLHGIDVSRWQGEINWKAVRDDRIDFAYLKSSEGRTWVDPKFYTNAQRARAAGMPVGAYHFARPDLNPTAEEAVKEARNFIAALQQGFGGCGDLYPALDLETPFPRNNKLMTTAALLAWVISFRNYFQQQTGSTLMLYSGAYFIKEYRQFRQPGAGFPLAGMPLWIALHLKSTQKITTVPPDAGNWKRWTVWQYSSTGKVNGIEGNVDLNRAVPELLNRHK